MGTSTPHFVGNLRDERHNF